jgi:hypothetical protein
MTISNGTMAHKYLRNMMICNYKMAHKYPRNILIRNDKMALNRVKKKMAPRYQDCSLYRIALSNSKPENNYIFI